jgi:hypothetical protein
MDSISTNESALDHRKNFNFLNSRVQNIYFTFQDDKKLIFAANVKEKFLPYHEENFAVFMQKYKK